MIAGFFVFCGTKILRVSHLVSQGSVYRLGLGEGRPEIYPNAEDFYVNFIR
jgi:hypothetical protein